MPRILIVEDEVHLAQGLLFNLEAEGHEAVAVESGELALDRLLKDLESFDAMVLDVMLPGINGFEVAAKLREAQNYTPILMLTARARPEDVLKGFASGADDYLPKPFDLAILLARVHGLLRRTGWAGRQRSPTGRRARLRRSSISRPHAGFFDPGTDLSGGQGATDADGGQPAALLPRASQSQREPQADSGRSVGTARGHRHACHR